MSVIIDENNEAIYPTNTCFDDVTNWINREFLRIGIKLRKYVVCHGLLKKSNGGIYSHCWLEEPWLKQVISFGIKNESKIGYRARIKEFQKEFNVMEKTTYSIQEVCMLQRLARGTMNLGGPWKLKYLKEVKDYNPLWTYFLNEEMGKVQIIKKE